MKSNKKKELCWTFTWYKSPMHVALHWLQNVIFLFRHVGEAGTVEHTAKSSLLEAEKALALMRTVINGENNVAEQLSGLRTQ